MIIQKFIGQWIASSASDRANKSSFLNELCDALDVPRPAPTTSDRYVF